MSAVFFLVLLVLAVLIFSGAFFAGRKLSTFSQRRRLVVLGGLLCLGSIAPVEAWSGWAVAVPFHGLLYALSVVAYLLAIVAAWVCADGPLTRRLGRALSIVLCLPFCNIVFDMLKDPVGALAVLLVASGMQQQTVSSMRISPTLTYTTGTSHSLWGNTPFQSYEISRNLRLLPLIQKQVGKGPTNCESGQITFSLGRDENTLLMSCKLLQPWHGQSALTTEVPLR
jgi:hypothetical protein